jgi:hypothetical protein
MTYIAPLKKQATAEDVWRRRARDQLEARRMFGRTLNPNLEARSSAGDRIRGLEARGSCLRIPRGTEQLLADSWRHGARTNCSQIGGGFLPPGGGGFLPHGGAPPRNR